MIESECTVCMHQMERNECKGSAELQKERGATALYSRRCRAVRRVAEAEGMRRLTRAAVASRRRTDSSCMSIGRVGSARTPPTRASCARAPGT